MKNEGTHGVLLLVVGGYIAYMGVKMLENTKAGLSTMSMTTTVILMSVMILAGLAVIAYGILTFIRGWKMQQQSITEEDTTNISKEDNSK